MNRIGEDMSRPNIVIVGGGFGGLAAAKALRNTPAEIVLIDRTNHHLFQPLLYQVATSVLTPGQIGSPLPGTLRKHENNNGRRQRHEACVRQLSRPGRSTT